MHFVKNALHPKLFIISMLSEKWSVSTSLFEWYVISWRCRLAHRFVEYGRCGSNRFGDIFYSFLGICIVCTWRKCDCHFTFNFFILKRSAKIHSVWLYFMVKIPRNIFFVCFRRCFIISILYDCAHIFGTFQPNLVLLSWFATYLWGSVLIEHKSI